MSEMEDLTLDRCTDRQLRVLLGLASADSGATRNWLIEVGDLDRLESLLAEMCAGAWPSAGELLRAVRSPQIPLETLSIIKSRAKKMTAAADSPEQRAAATLLYHLAIASALAHHQRNISSREAAGRLALYRELAAELPDDELADIFDKAVLVLPGVA